MAETNAVKLRRVLRRYREARADVTRNVVGGWTLTDYQRAELVNAQHALAEHVEETTR